MMLLTAVVGYVLEVLEYHFGIEIQVMDFWTRLSPLVTFVTTFFLNASYKFWNRFYWSTRGIQGRFNDISLICASNATRDSDGNLTEGANRSLTDIKRIMGVLHNMYWCSVVIRFRCICKSLLAISYLMQRHNSRLSAHIMYLVTPEGFSYLKSKQLITFEEYRSLIEISKDGLVSEIEMHIICIVCYK